MHIERGRNSMRPAVGPSCLQENNRLGRNGGWAFAHESALLSTTPAQCAPPMAT